MCEKDAMNQIGSFLVAAALATAGCVHSSYVPMRIPLRWKPTDEMRLGPVGAVAGLNQQRIAIGPFLDGRQDLQQIGKNIENGGNAPVTTGDGVGAFLGARFADVLQANDVRVATAGATRIIKAEVLRYFVTEENTYSADVALRFTVEDPGGGAIWQGVAEGTSNRFGRSYKAENYHEALSNAFLEACKSLVSTPAFLDAFRQ